MSLVGKLSYYGVLAIALIFPTTWASGADPVEALVRDSIELRRAGRDGDALKKLEEAFLIAPTPRVTAQLGLCLQALGRWAEADVRLSEALLASGDPWIRGNRETLKDSLETVKKHVGRVEVLGTPEGADVFLNGRLIGKLPLSDAISVNEGNLDVEARAEGYTSDSKTLNIVGGSYVSPL